MLNIEIMKLAKTKKYNLYDSSVSAASFVSGCADWCEIRVFTAFPVIVNIQFSHRGCMLSRASIIAIIDEVIGKTKDEAIQLILNFRRMLVKPFFMPELPEKLMLFKKFSKFPSRRNCLLMGCNALIEEISAIKE